MHNLKKFGPLALVVFALSAIGAANASAAQFTASAVGNLSGFAPQTQVFQTNAGQVKCTVAEISGAIVSTASTEQHVTVNYKNCTAFGFANVHITPATYLLTASGSIHVKNTITINTTLGCHQTIHPQPVGGLAFFNYHGTILVTPHSTGIAYTSTGGLCGAAGNNGTFTGNTIIERVGGGTMSHHL